jgi:pimeloyl-ACP methyl ester carboxylesterase
MNRSTPRTRRNRITAAIGIVAAAALIPLGTTAASATPHPCTPTIVLEHGAWATGASWDGVAHILRSKGYTVDVAPNSLRSLSADTAQLKAYLAHVHGPIVLAGHSYGGAVISNAAAGNTQVKALVFDDAYIPEVGETVSTLSGPESALAVADPTTVFKLVPYAGAPAGIYDTYLLPDVVKNDFAQDLPRAVQKYLFTTQAPTSLLALGEPSAAAAWKTIPSWDIAGKQDHIIPLAAQLAMAKRAGSHVTEIDSSHVSLVSHPGAVASVILKAVHATD